MKKYILTSILLLAFFIGNAQLKSSIYYKLPILPITISYDGSNFELSLDQSINTPLGTFGIEVENTRLTEENPTYIVKEDFTKVNFYEKENTLLKTENRDLKNRNKILKNKLNPEFLVILKNINSSESKIFKIIGIDVLDIESNGKTKISIQRNKIIIDFAFSEVDKLIFRGKQINTENIDEISKLCLKFDSQFNPDKSKFYLNIKPNTSDKYKLEEHYDYIKKLMTLANITNPNERIISSLGSNFIISNKGIYLSSHKEKNKLVNIFKKKRVFETNFEHKFISWNELINLNFYQIKNSRYEIENNKELPIRITNFEKLDDIYDYNYNSYSNSGIPIVLVKSFNDKYFIFRSSQVYSSTLQIRFIELLKKHILK